MVLRRGSREAGALGVAGRDPDPGPPPGEVSVLASEMASLRACNGGSRAASCSLWGGRRRRRPSEAGWFLGCPPQALSLVKSSLMRIAVGLLIAALAMGCSSDSEKRADPEEAAILRVVREANRSFAQGDYARTCSYYSPALRRRIATEGGARNCAAGWAAIARVARELMTPEQLDALVGYQLESAEIDGDTATGIYGEPPKAIEDQPNVREGAEIELERVGNRWLIASLPGD